MVAREHFGDGVDRFVPSGETIGRTLFSLRIDAGPDSILELLVEFLPCLANARRVVAWLAERYRHVDYWHARRPVSLPGLAAVWAVREAHAASALMWRSTQSRM